MQNFRGKKRRSAKRRPQSRFNSLKEYLKPKTEELNIKSHVMNNDMESAVLSTGLGPFEIQNVPKRNKWLNRGNAKEQFENIMDMLNDKQKGRDTKLREYEQQTVGNKKSGSENKISEEKIPELESSSSEEKNGEISKGNDSTQEERLDITGPIENKRSSAKKELVPLLNKDSQSSMTGEVKQTVSDSHLYRIKAKRTSRDLDALLEAKDTLLRNRRQSNLRSKPKFKLPATSKEIQTDQQSSSKSKKLRDLTDETKAQACDIGEKNRIIEEKDEEIRSLNCKLQELMAKLVENENQRKVLNMELQQTKGNIRIFCRVKPKARNGDAYDDGKAGGNENRKIVKARQPKAGKKPREALSPRSAPEISYIEVIDQGEKPRMLSVVDPDTFKRKNYFFDRLFTDTAGQGDVFGELEGYITAAYDGGKIVIFAYGQTGSGKTYTLQGVPANPGVLPRALEMLVAMKERDGKLLDEISISISVLEIYNERLIDLLEPKKETISIQVKNNVVHLSGLSKVHISDYNQLEGIVQSTASNRNVEKTAFNDESSRSHCLYRIKISKTDFDGKKTKGLLNIIDLAGCERFSDDIEDPQKLKKVQTEANFINKSLTTLGRILRIKKENRVMGCNKNLPIRETKLTRVLQDCMDDEQAVTLMIVNVCQDEGNFNQTREALNFSVINV